MTTDPNKANNPQDSDDFDADWAAAMAEQEAGESAATTPESGTQAEGLADAMGDDWAAALAEQTAATNTQSETLQEEPQAAPKIATPASAAVFPQLDKNDNAANSDIDMIMDIPVQLSVELGRARLTLKHILQLGQGSVVELDGLAGEPMDIFVNGYLIAQGEVVVVEEKYGIRITDIVTPSDRIQRLNSRR